MEVVKLTEKAQQQVKTLLSKGENPREGLRVAIVGRSCRGFQYKIGWDNAKEDDNVHEYNNGVKIIVDPQSTTFLKRATMGFVENGEGSGFEITNPHEKECGRCGDSCKPPE
jgi:iron-sulfur cluster assembly accessory protein